MDSFKLTDRLTDVWRVCPVDVGPLWYCTLWVLLFFLGYCCRIFWSVNLLHIYSGAFTHLYFCAIYLPEGRGVGENWIIREILEKRNNFESKRCHRCVHHRSHGSFVTWVFVKFLPLLLLFHWGNQECQWCCCCHSCWRLRFTSNNQQVKVYSNLFTQSRALHTTLNLNIVLFLWAVSITMSLCQRLIDQPKNAL